MIIEFLGIALGFPICVYQNSGAWVNQFSVKSIKKCTIGGLALHCSNIYIFFFYLSKICNVFDSSCFGNWM